ncbi:MAG: hypothetical protein HZB91_03675 [Elusimicrobia bacterium]|nr:hypothetical protein [Elusimicrobiota bacterium]
MKPSSVKVAALGFTLGTFVALPLSHASTHPLGFEESFKGVFRHLYAPVEGFKHKQAEIAPPVPYARLIEISDAVFESSPKASAELAHLKLVAHDDLISSGGWEEFSQFEDSLGRNLNRKGVFFSPGMRRKIYVVGAGLMWHQAQHIYDSRIPSIKAAESAGGTPLESIEAETRGWQAGCSFWKAGNGMNVSMGGNPYADAFGCSEGFPKAYHCKYHSAAEAVILTTYKMKLLDRIGEEGTAESAAGIPDLAGARAGLELELAAACAEFERGTKGNPLSLEGFRFEWTVSQCVDKALRTVNAPGWKSSKELCPARADSADAGVRHRGFP